MGGTLSTHDVDSFAHYSELAYDIKSRDLNAYTRNLKRNNFWADLESGDQDTRYLGNLAKERIRQLELNRNDTYLVAGIISNYYEDILDGIRAEYRHLEKKVRIIKTNF